MARIITFVWAHSQGGIVKNFFGHFSPPDYGIIRLMKKNTTDEETVAVCHPTLIPYIPWAAFSIFILLLAPFAHGVLAYQLISTSLIVLVICAVLAAFRVYGRTYYFTTERIVTRCGLLALDISEVRIEDVRGVKCDYSVQSLLNKGFIEEQGRRETLGRPILYGTTDKFLQHFGMETLADLPEVEALTPEGEIGI